MFESGAGCAIYRMDPRYPAPLPTDCPQYSPIFFLSSVHKAAAQGYLFGPSFPPFTPPADSCEANLVDDFSSMLHWPATSLTSRDMYPLFKLEYKFPSCGDLPV